MNKYQVIVILHQYFGEDVVIGELCLDQDNYWSCTVECMLTGKIGLVSLSGTYGNPYVEWL